MSQLKIKVNIGNFNVELEGDSEEVITQFDQLKKTGLGQIVDQLATRFQPNTPTTESLTTYSENAEKPLIPSSLDPQPLSLQDVVYKQLPNSEKEWIVIYGYYLEREKINPFQRGDIIKKYEESKRKSDVRIKNLSSSIKNAVKKTWISAINDKDFIITDIGKKYALEILSRQEATIKIAKKGQKKMSDKSTNMKNESTDESEIK